MSENVTCTKCNDTGSTITTSKTGTRRTWCDCDAGHLALNDFLRAGIAEQDNFTEEAPKLTIVPRLEEPKAEAPPIVEVPKQETPIEAPSNVITFKTPIEALIKKELNTDRFILAFYDNDGNIGFYNGDGINPEDICYITDLMKARLMSMMIDM